MTNEQHEYLELMRKQAGGTLDPTEVLADARNPNSPLHVAFEWDDETAAAAYRLDQARKLIRVHVQTMGQRQSTTPRVRILPSGPKPREAPVPSLLGMRGEIINAARQEAVARVEAVRALRRADAWAAHRADLIAALDLLEGDTARSECAVVSLYVRGAPLDELVEGDWTRDKLTNLISRYAVSRADGWSAERAALGWRDAGRHMDNEIWGFPAYEVPGARPPRPMPTAITVSASSAPTSPAPLPAQREVQIEQISWNEMAKWAVNQGVKQGDHRTYQDVMTTVNRKRADLGLPLWEAKLQVNGGVKIIRGAIPEGLVVQPTM